MRYAVKANVKKAATAVALVGAGAFAIRILMGAVDKVREVRARRQ